jgi:hypothetical protein
VDWGRGRGRGRSSALGGSSPETQGQRQVLGIVAPAEGAPGLGGGPARAPGYLEAHVAAARPRRTRARPQLRGADLDAGLGQQSGGELRVEGARHRQHRQVLGADAPVLARHVRVQGVPRLGHRTAEDAAVARADGVLVLQVGAEGVRRAVDLAALWAGPRIRRSHPQDVDAASGCGTNGIALFT